MNQTKSPRRWVKRIALSFILLFGVVVAFLIIERVRGSLALKSRINELTARGERLNVKDLEPAHAEAGDDAAAALLLLSNRLDAVSSLWIVAPPSGRFTEPGKQVVASRLAAWSYEKKTNGWLEVQALLAQDGALATDIHSALQRRGWNDGCDYHNGFIDFKTGPLVMWKSLSQRLAVSALAALEAGDTEAAVARIEDSARLVKLQTNSPLIICQLVRIASATIAWNATWEVVTSGKCSEPQLARLQAAWEGMDFSTDMARAMEMERAMTLDHYNLLAESAKNRAKALEDIASMAEFGLGSEPLAKGAGLRRIHTAVWSFAWVRQDELRSLNRWQQVIEFDRAARTNSWDSVKDGVTALDDDPGWLADALSDSKRSKMNLYDRTRFLFSGMTFSVGSQTTRKAMQAETQRRMMVVAIALRRHRIGHGKFPDHLDRLVPEFIREVPVDLMNNKPLAYRLADKGSPLLYSVGDDGRDDGGDFSLATATKEYRKIWDGKDAVWPSPASAEEAEKAANKK